MRSMVITPEAIDRMIAIKNSYKEISLSIGERFNREVERALRMIQEFPEASPKALARSRKIRLRRFPYNIFFSYNTESVTVWHIFHTSRDIQILRKLEV